MNERGQTNGNPEATSDSGRPSAESEFARVPVGRPSKPKKQQGKKSPKVSKRARTYISQTEVPRHSLDEALRVPQAIFDQYGLEPTRPLSVAQALDMLPNSSRFRTLCGAAIAYGLTEGGPNAPVISVTALGKQIVAPTEEGADLDAKRDAMTQPRVARQFFERYDGKPLPREDIAVNVLSEFGVRRDAAKRCLEVLLDNIKSIGSLKVIKGVQYVDLQRPDGTPVLSAVEAVLPAPAPTPSAPPPSAAKARKAKDSHRLVAEPLATSEKQASSLPIVLPAEATGPLRRGLKVDAYVLQERLGSGFSAEVWSATVESPPAGVEITGGATVAIKFYHAHAMALPDQVIRIEREFRIAQGIRHPNLIRIYEFVLASSRPHHNFLVMDVAQGRTLRGQIPPMGLPVHKAVEIGQQILRALEELHGQGALHRDIKPGNIAVADGPSGIHATLLDLGIVTVMHERNLTAASRFLGSKHWAPYEQVVGEPLDARSDIYSVGAVLYNLLTGEEPYSDKGTEAAVAVEMARRPLRLPDRQDVPVPAGLRDLVNRCLSTAPLDRPSTARDCLTLLERSL